MLRKSFLQPCFWYTLRPRALRPPIEKQARGRSCLREQLRENRLLPEAVLLFFQ